MSESKSVMDQDVAEKQVKNPKPSTADDFEDESEPSAVAGKNKSKASAANAKEEHEASAANAIEKQEASAANAKEKHKASAANAKEEHEASAANAKEKHEASAANAKEEHEASAANAKEEHEASTANAKEEHEASAANAKEEHEASAANAKEEHKASASACKENAVNKNLQYKEIKGDLFKCPETSSLAHCISKDLSMSKGIASIFKANFGRVKELKNQAKNVGECAVLEFPKRNIYYLVTKERYYHKPTYGDLEDTLKDMKIHCQENGVKELSIPQLGCGLDQMDWKKVSSLIQKVFADVHMSITVYIFK